MRSRLTLSEARTGYAVCHESYLPGLDTKHAFAAHALGEKREQDTLP